MKNSSFLFISSNGDKCIQLKTQDEWIFAYQFSNITTVIFNNNIIIDDISKSTGKEVDDKEYMNTNDNGDFIME